MNTKRVLPILFIVLLAIAALAIRHCNSPVAKTTFNNNTNTGTSRKNGQATSSINNSENIGLDRNTTDLFFTKHAKCRMKCRQISQQEVRDILINGKVNYNKSNLNDPKGPTYALEGNTRDGQQVRIIFAPHQQHLTVVTVIDLGVEHTCDCT